MRMLKLAMAAAAMTLLSGCATLGTIAEAGKRVCDNRESISVALNLALTQAFTIADETRRDLAEKGLRISLAALSACPNPD